MSYTQFKKVVWDFYTKQGRHDLLWRKTTDPYKILVSEVMLQQTQVHRVIPMYAEFTRRYPIVRKLAAAPFSDVLRAWQGLGYNRRAKMLHQAAKIIAKQGMPQSVEELEKLPGVGPYTARAVAAFAFNQDVIFVETNIRTAVIHHFSSRFTGVSSARSAQAARPILHLAKNTPAPLVSDREILEILETLLPVGKSREWYSALMDYGAHLKKSGVKLNTKSKHYLKQSRFDGSLRQVRGAILKALTAHAPLTRVRKEFPNRYIGALAALEKDGLIRKRGRGWDID